MNIGKRCLCVLAFVGQLSSGESAEEATRQFQAIDKIAKQNINVLMGNNRNHLLTPLEMKRPLRQKFSWLAETLSKENPLNFLQQKLSSMSQAIFVDELTSSAWYLFKLIKADLQTCLWQANFDDALVDNALLALLLQKSTGTSVTSDYWKTAEKEYREAAILVAHTIPGCFLTQYVPEPQNNSQDGKVDLNKLWKNVMSPFADNQPDELKLENMSQTFVKYLKEAIEYRTEWIKNKCDNITLKNDKNVRIKNIKSIADIYNESCDNYKDGLKKQWDSVCSETSEWCLRDVQSSASSIAGQSNSCLILSLNPNKLWSQCLNGSFAMDVPLRSSIYNKYPEKVQNMLDEQTTRCNKDIVEKNREKYTRTSDSKLITFDSDLMLSDYSSKFLAQALGSCPFIFKNENDSGIDSNSLISQQENNKQKWPLLFNLRTVFECMPIENPFGAAVLVRFGGSHYASVVLAKKPMSIKDEITLFERGHWNSVNPYFCQKYWGCLPFSDKTWLYNQDSWRNLFNNQMPMPFVIKNKLNTLKFNCYVGNLLKKENISLDQVKEFTLKKDIDINNISVRIVDTDIFLTGKIMLSSWELIGTRFEFTVKNKKNGQEDKKTFDIIDDVKDYIQDYFKNTSKLNDTSFELSFADGTKLTTIDDLSLYDFL